MEIFKTALQLYAPIIINGIMRAIVIFVASLGAVYMFGRMLNIVHSNRGRNLLAIITSFPFSYWLVVLYDKFPGMTDLEVLWRTIIFGFGACILFVLIGWKLFERVDHFLDKKIAPDGRSNGKSKRRK